MSCKVLEGSGKPSSWSRWAWLLPCLAEWVRRTLIHLLNLTYKSTKPQAKIVSKGTELEAQQTLKRKITWLCEEKNIPFERVLNMDQTAVLLLPTWEKSWSPKSYWLAM